MYKIIIFLYIFFTMYAYATPVNTLSEQQRVQSLVKQVKTAKPSDKRILMNRLKIMLRKSNHEHRMQIMKELKKSFSSKHMMHQGRHKGKHKFRQSENGKHQAKRRRHRAHNGEGRRGGGEKKGGGNQP